MSGKQVTQVPVTPFDPFDSGPDRTIPKILRALLVGGKLGLAADFAREVKAPRSVLNWFERASVNLITLLPGTIPEPVNLQPGTDRGWFDSAIDSGFAHVAPLNTQVKIQIGDLTPAARLIAEPIVIRALSLNSTALTPLYCGYIIVITRELARQGGSILESFLARVHQTAMAKGTDKLALQAIISTGTPSGTAPDFATGIQQVLQAISVTSSSRVFLLLSPRAAQIGSSLQSATGGAMYPDLSVSGGRIGGHQAFVTDGMEDAAVAALDVDALIAARGTVETDVSDQADLNMVDDPATGASTLVSLFQSNSSAARILRTFGIELTRDDALATCTINEPGP